ncbi:MAG: hypothetical protein AB7G80_05005 [Dongiaceae bacterium]
MAIFLNGGNFLPTIQYGAAQNVTVGASSVQSSAVAAGTRLIRLCANVPCRVAIGSNPTASATSTLIPANSVEVVEIAGGHKVAVIQDSAGGTLSVTEAVV